MILTSNEYFKIVNLVVVFGATEPHWRTGQCLFNAIHTINNVVGDHIRGREYDTFYTTNPDEIIKCWKYLDSITEKH